MESLFFVDELSEKARERVRKFLVLLTKAEAEEGTAIISIQRTKELTRDAEGVGSGFLPYHKV